MAQTERTVKDCEIAIEQEIAEYYRQQMDLRTAHEWRMSDLAEAHNRGMFDLYAELHDAQDREAPTPPSAVPSATTPLEENPDHTPCTSDS